MRVLTFLARRFVAGETAEDAIAVVRELNARGLKGTLDFLGEECRTSEQAKAGAAEIIALLGKLAAAGVDSNVSLKLTQLGLSLDGRLARGLLASVLDAAARHDNFVRIDMESSAYTERTLELFHDLFRARKNVGVVIQAYLRRSAADVAELCRLGARVRLCKGAYKEPPEVAFSGKEEVNASFDALARVLLARGTLPAIATHDDARIEAALSAARENKLAKDRFELQMLYGLRPSRWDELARQGHTVRVYIPYGTHWLPYYYRRIRERKENLLFVVKSLWNG